MLNSVTTFNSKQNPLDIESDLEKQKKGETTVTTLWVETEELKMLSSYQSHIKLLVKLIRENKSNVTLEAKLRYFNDLFSKIEQSFDNVFEGSLGRLKSRDSKKKEGCRKNAEKDILLFIKEVISIFNRLGFELDSSCYLDQSSRVRLLYSKLKFIYKCLDSFDEYELTFYDSYLILVEYAGFNVGSLSLAHLNVAKIYMSKRNLFSADHDIIVENLKKANQVQFLNKEIFEKLPEHYKQTCKEQIFVAYVAKSSYFKDFRSANPKIEKHLESIKEIAILDLDYIREYARNCFLFELDPSLALNVLETCKKTISKPGFKITDYSGEGTKDILSDMAMLHDVVKKKYNNKLREILSQFPIELGLGENSFEIETIDLQELKEIVNTISNICPKCLIVQEKDKLIVSDTFKASFAELKEAIQKIQIILACRSEKDIKAVRLEEELSMEPLSVVFESKLTLNACEIIQEKKSSKIQENPHQELSEKKMIDDVGDCSSDTNQFSSVNYIPEPKSSKLKKKKTKKTPVKSDDKFSLVQASAKSGSSHYIPEFDCIPEFNEIKGYNVIPLINKKNMFIAFHPDNPFSYHKSATKLPKEKEKRFLELMTDNPKCIGPINQNGFKIWPSVKHGAKLVGKIKTDPYRLLPYYSLANKKGQKVVVYGILKNTKSGKRTKDQLK